MFASFVVFFFPRVEFIFGIRIPSYGISFPTFLGVTAPKFIIPLLVVFTCW